MGYLIGGSNRSKIVTSGLEEEFKNLTQVPVVSPVRGANLLKSGDSSLKKSYSSTLDVQRSAPLFNDPRYTSSTLAIPSDSRSLNGLYRFFAETDPIVGSALKLHVDLPCADLRLGSCEDPGIQQHYEEMWDRINGVKIICDAVSELHEIGDAFLFGAFNETDYMWEQFAVLNPDYVKVEGSWVNSSPLIKLIPDEALKKLVHSKSPRYLYDQLPPEIIQYVLFNQEIPLDPNNIFHLANAKRPYELRGRSLIKRILKTLMLEDRFNQANFALATRHAVPLTVVKVGDPNSGWLPAEEDLNAVRDMVAAYELDPNFSIIYHWGINVEYYGSNGKMLPIGPELDRIYRLKFIGLQVHEQLLAGQGGSYSQAYINMEVQRQRYLNLQLRIDQMVHSGWFKVIADLCGFYRVRNSISSSGHTSKYSWGNPQDSNTREVVSSIRDFQDNVEYQSFINHKKAEATKQIREYVYPKLDWGGMNASNDENLKNYIKWLADKRPWLVDDGTLARLAKLDRDTQERSFLQDVKRDQERLLSLSKDGLLQVANSRGKMFGSSGGSSSGVDLGGMSDFGGGEIPLGGGSIDVGNEPSAPIGFEGPPDTSSGTEPPMSDITSSLKNLESEIRSDEVQSDLLISSDNNRLLRLKEMEKYAVLREVSNVS